MTKKIYIIIPVYNRVETTLQCLDRLSSSGVMEWAHVVVVDDASPDGTAEAIEQRYSSDKVTVLHGDGNLWWAGGINMGMEYAYKKGAEYFVWLNDDCRPIKKASFRTLVDYSIEHQCVAVGRVVLTSGGVYTGRRKKLMKLVSVPCSDCETVECDTFGGNAVCIPRGVVDCIGYPDAVNFPMMADTDYGLVATKARIKIVVVGAASFENDDNLSVEHESFLLSEKPTVVLLRATFGSLKSFYYFPSYYKMRIKHFGMIRGHLIVFQMVCKYASYILLRIFLPRNLRIRLFGRHLRAWKIQQSYKNEGAV